MAWTKENLKVVLKEAFKFIQWVRILLIHEAYVDISTEMESMNNV